MVFAEELSLEVPNLFGEIWRSQILRVLFKLKVGSMMLSVSEVLQLDLVTSVRPRGILLVPALR